MINGEKLWCTNGTIAEMIVVMARTGPKKITAFIVETDWPAFEVLHRLHFMGLKAIQNGFIRFTNVRVPVDNMLWGEGKGLKLALVTLNTGRLTLPASSAAAPSGPQDRPPLGERAGAMGRADRQARSRRAEARPNGVRDLRHGSRDRFASLLATGATRHPARSGDGQNVCSEAGWKIIDDTLQIRGGRGYETADAQGRGEKPEPSSA